MQAKLQKAKEILARQEVPTIPDEVLQLQEELNKKYPNTVTIANLISHNPELYSDFMNLVNTNLTDENTDIRDAKGAVNALGLEEIYNIFLSANLTALLGQSYAEKQILLHGAKAGIAAAELSYWVMDISRSEAYMAGLMQNVGAIYLSRHCEDYETLFESELSNPISAFAKETEKYGTDHTILAAILTKKWHVDPDIYKAILFHHDMDFFNKTASNQKVSHLVALIILADYIVSSTTGEQYITQELKDYRDAAKLILKLPENALKAATSAVMKWGNKVGLSAGSH